jgi:hypothetical protein
MYKPDKTLMLVRSVVSGESERKRRWITEMLAAGAGVFAELTERYGPERLHAKRPLEDLLTVIAAHAALEPDDVVKHKQEAHDEAAAYVDEDEHIWFCDLVLDGMFAAVESILDTCGVALTSELVCRLAAQVNAVNQLERDLQRDGTFGVPPVVALDRTHERLAGDPAAEPRHGLQPRAAQPRRSDGGD